MLVGKSHGFRHTYLFISCKRETEKQHFAFYRLEFCLQFLSLKASNLTF